MEHVGIFGGSFDPVHIGHLIIAERALEHFRFDRILLIPAHHPPHKRGLRAAPEDRLAMLRAAVHGHPRLKVDPIEIRRKGVSYTIDTLAALRRRRPGARFTLILGADALQLLPEWNRIGELAGLTSFAVTGRPDHPVPKMPIKKGSMTVFKTPLMEISSSDIRRRVRRGKSIRWMTPPAVAALIEKRGLYLP